MTDAWTNPVDIYQALCKVVAVIDTQQALLREHRDHSISRVEVEEHSYDLEIREIGFGELRLIRSVGTLGEYLGDVSERVWCNTCDVELDAEVEWD